MAEHFVRAFVAAVAFTLAIPATASPPVNPPGRYIVFGDSLVDAGNANIATGGAAAPAALGYFQGRFTNGPVWTDWLNKAATGRFTTPFLAGGDSYAVGGARGANDSFIPPFPQPIPGLNSQLGIYAGASGGVVDPNAVYTLVFGNNDVNAIQSGDTAGLTAQQFGALYASNMANAAVGLYLGGATKIILLGVPNPGEPEGVTLQAQLDAALDAASAGVPGLSSVLYRFDLFDFFTRLRAHPTQFGLAANTDFFTPCLVARLPGPGIDCTGYFSFDGTHPTAPVHLALAREISAFAGVPGVPEPASWALMIAGFGLVGAAMRRRAHAVA